MRRPGQASILSIALVVAVSILVLATVTSFSGFSSFSIQPPEELQQQGPQIEEPEIMPEQLIMEQPAPLQTQAATNISNCVLISSPGSYVLNQSIINTSYTPCITINANDVTLDCQSNLIDGTGSGYGVRVQSYLRPIIKNCKLSDWTYGIYVDTVNNSQLINNTVSSSQMGIRAYNLTNSLLDSNNCQRSTYGMWFEYYSANNNLTNNIVSNNANRGIYFNNHCDNNTLTNNTVSYNAQNEGIYVAQSANNTFINNTITTNGYSGSYSGMRIDGGQGNNTIINNTIRNNGYQGLYVTSCSNNNISNNIAIGNSYYGLYLQNSDYNNISDNTFCVNSQADLVMDSSSNFNYGNNTCKTRQDNDANSANCTTSCPAFVPGACKQTISANTTLTEDILGCYFGGITFGANNITLDCQGHTMSGIYPYNNGITIQSKYNSTVKNCTIVNFGTGLYSYYSYNGRFTNNTISGNNRGIYNYLSNYNNLTENNMTGNNYGLSIEGSSDSNFNHTIDMSNTINGKLVYYLKSISNAVYDSSTNAGFFFCGWCGNITVRDLSLNNNSHGLILWRTSNSRIQNVTTSYNYWAGVYLRYANNNNLTNIVAKNNNGWDGYGVFIQDSSNANFTNADLSMNRYGFVCNSCSNADITNITSNNNIYYGIQLDHSSATLKNSVTNNNNASGVFLASTASTLINVTTQENTQLDLDIVLNNFWECPTSIQNMTGSGGRPIYYANSAVDWSNLEASEIVLCNADNSNLTNITISGSDTLHNNMLSVRWTEYANISNVTSSNNQQGIVLVDSANSIVEYCTTNNNQYHGIQSVRSNYANITNNTANANSQYGIDVEDNSNYNFVASNTVRNNNRGISAQYNSYNIFVNNAAANNTDSGMFVFDADYNTLTNNTASNNPTGIWLAYGSNNILTNNTANNCISNGIYFEDEDYDNITGNTANSNNNNGIQLQYYSNFNNLIANTANNNGYRGIVPGIGCSYNNLINNTANGNRYGLWLYSEGDYNVLTDNTACANSIDDIYLSADSNDNSGDNACENLQDDDANTVTCLQSCPDADSDGIQDAFDNCPSVANPGQENTDLINETRLISLNSSNNYRDILESGHYITRGWDSGRQGPLMDDSCAWASGGRGPNCWDMGGTSLYFEFACGPCNATTSPWQNTNGRICGEQNGMSDDNHWINCIRSRTTNETWEIQIMEWSEHGGDPSAAYTRPGIFSTDNIGNACDCGNDTYCTAYNYCCAQSTPDADCATCPTPTPPGAAPQKSVPSAPSTITEAFGGGTFDMFVGGTVNFAAMGESHSAKLKTVTSGYVTIDIYSSPITVTLSEGESKDIDMDGNSLNDLRIELLQILLPDGARIKLTPLQESLPSAPIPAAYTYCGDGSCGNGENAVGCPADCAKTVAYAAPTAMFSRQSGSLVTFLIILLLAAVIYVVWHKLNLRYGIKVVKKRL